MIVDEFRSLLAQSDLEFVDVIETEAFQRMLEKDFSFHSELDQSSQWRLLYGLWVVLLDFADDPGSAWRPSEAAIPGPKIFLFKCSSGPRCCRLRQQ